MPEPLRMLRRILRSAQYLSYNHEKHVFRRSGVEAFTMRDTKDFVALEHMDATFWSVAGNASQELVYLVRRESKEGCVYLLATHWSRAESD